MTLLYIDDDQDDQEIFCEVVQSVDSTLKCFTAKNGHEALEIIQNNHIDIAFVDYRMPVMDGKMLLAKLKSLPLKSLPKIYLYSTYMDEREMEECKKLGAEDCIRKPGEFDEIRKLLIAVLKR